MAQFATATAALKYYEAEGFKAGVMRCLSTGKQYLAVFPPDAFEPGKELTTDCQCPLCGAWDSRLARLVETA